MNALVENSNKHDNSCECRGPFAVVGNGMTVEQAAHDLENKLDQLRNDIERWTGHRLSFDGDAFLA